MRKYYFLHQQNTKLYTEKMNHNGLKTECFFEIPNKIKNLFISSKDWSDFNERVGSLSTKEKGSCFEQITKFYLI